MRFILALILSLSCYHKVIATPLNHIFLGSREGDPASLVKNVCTMSGGYSEIETDLTVPGPDPLTISRLYSSQDDSSIATFGGWRFYPQCFLILEKDPSQHYTTAEGTFYRSYAKVGTKEGSILTYVGWVNPQSKSLLKPDIEEHLFSLANTARSKVQSQTNLKNNSLEFDSQNGRFELTLCDGGKRFYHKHSILNLYLLYKEILPSGNIVTYEYTSDAHLTIIKLINSKEEKVLSWIKIDKGYVETSDGQTVSYHFDQNSFLKSVTRSHKPSITYHYQQTHAHPLLVQKELPKGHTIDIEYTEENPPRTCLVTLPEGDVTAFTYQEESTTIQGPLGRKAIHYYNDDLQLIAIEEYLENSLYRTFKKFWGNKKDACNLISETLEDGAGQTHFAKTYTYDENGNLLEEKEYGNLTGASSEPLAIDDEGIPYEEQEAHTKSYTYYTIDGVNVVNQIDAKKNGIRYCYKPGSNLLLRKSILEGNKRKKRWFYRYNEDGTLTQTIVDDGSETLENSLSSVHQRLITTIIPKQDLPFVGAPEIIEEKYLDLKTRQEILLKKTVNHFDCCGNITSQNIYDGEENHLYTLYKSYNEQGLLAAQTNSLGYQIKYSYDVNHNLVSIENKDIILEYQYDLNNRPIYSSRKSHSIIFETYTSYDPYGNILSATDQRGNLTKYSYDSLGRLKSTTHPHIVKEKGSLFTPVTTYTYDIFDNPTCIIDPNGSITQTSYTPRSTPIEIKHPDGNLELFKYDPEGSLHRYLGKDGIIQVFEYDYLGRVSHIEYYERGATGRKDGFKRKYYTYNAFHLTSEKDEGGYQTYYSYDEAGRLQSIKKDTKKTEYFYNSQGRISEVKTWKSQDNFTLQVRDYDVQGHLIEKRTEDSQGNILLKSKYTYDPSGNLLSEIGYPANKETVLNQYEYDPFERPIKIIDAFQQKTEVQYDDHYTNSYGQHVLKTLEIDPLGNQLEKIYDVFDHQAIISKKSSQGTLLCTSETFSDIHGNKVTKKIQVFSPNHPAKAYTIEKTYTPTFLLNSITFGSKTHHYTYNTYRDLSSQTSPEQDPITYKYNSKGQLQKIITKTSSPQKETSYELIVDARGNQTEARLGKVFSLSHRFDATNQPLIETIQDEWGSYQIKRTFDGEGNITEIKLPDSSTIKYTYQGPFVKTITRLTKEKKELYQYRVISRDLMGNTLEEILPGHVGSRYHSYDQGGRKTETSTDFFQETVPPEGYDPLSRIIKRKISIASRKYTYHYDYNFLSQLTSEKGPFENHYLYDSIGNRLEKNGEPYTISDSNELLEGEGISCIYDPSGNLITKTQYDGTWEFNYNGLNQLTSITSPNGSKTLFTYDIHGKRLSKIIKKKNSKPKVFRFFYLGSIEMGSLDEKGEICKLKVPIDPNTLSPSIAFEIQKEFYVPLYDLFGNVSCVIDPEKRTIVESYQYSAFGEEKILSRRGRPLKRSFIQNPWRYQNSRIDEENHLTYFGVRYYDPQMGRWISPDPAGDLDGPNLYTYCHNNPLTYIDPFGLAAQTNETKVNLSYFYGEVEPHCHCETHRTCKRGGDIRHAVKTSSWTGAFYYHSMEVLSHPRFQGGMEAFGGLTETIIGGGMALGSGGLAAPVGGLIMAHGLDHFFTGLQVAFSGNPTENVTMQLLQKTGMSSQTSNLVDGGLSIAGSMGSLAVIRANQLAAFSSFQLPKHTVIRKYKNFTPTVSKINNGSSRNRLSPNLQAKGSHSVFRRDPFSGRITHYESFKTQTNPFDPKPWESVMRLDNSGRGDISHFNKILKVEIFEPHIHEPNIPGGVRPAEYWEIPK